MFDKHYARYYDLFNREKPYKKEIRFVYKWADSPYSILDIGCGRASYWDHYPKSVQITGIEKSTEMIKGTGRNILQHDIKTIDKIKFFKTYGAATALFDVINYIPEHNWWRLIPLDPGGFFIFDIWDKFKVDREGFKKTVRIVDGIKRTINPYNYDFNSIWLEITVEDNGISFVENHKMYIYGHSDIEKFCGADFDIVETKTTKTWKKWYKLKRR
jgi:hypothetical protein